MTPANGSTRSAGEAARHYLAYGVLTTPVQPHGKKPWDFDRGRPRDAWEQLRVTPEDIECLFRPNANIGIILGAPSGGLVDVDLDCVEAYRVAPHLLPPTGMIGGRESATRSHFFYLTDDPPAQASDKSLDPCILDRKANTIAELRSTGGQTVVAPSVYGPDPEKGHLKPERFVWAEHSEPARVSIDVLQTAVRGVAAAALLGRYWPRSSRHDAALALAGGLRRAGWLEEPAVKFVGAVCAAANDEEFRDRESCVRSTFAASKDEKLTGWPKLIECLGERGKALVNAVTGWLNIAPKAQGVTFPSERGYEASPVTPERYVPPPPYVPFPTDCLPSPWDAFVREGANALKCDESLVALPLLAVLAGAIGNTRRVHLGGEWFEPAVLWTCPIAESGGMKTSAANLSLDLVRARQKRLVKEHKDAMKECKRRAKNSEDEEDEPEKPTLKRIVVADVTIEKLATLHDDNRRGLLVARDELAGWFGSFTKYKGKGGGTDEPNWLSMHRADAIIYDRKTGEKTQVFVPHAATSITGGIQPGVLRRLASHDLFESGMVARIIFAMPPRTPKTWSDDEISARTKDAARQSLDALFALNPETDDDGDPTPALVKLSTAAKGRLKRFVNTWGVRQFEAEGARAASLAKLEAVPGRFALIHHTVRAAGTLEDTQPIGLDSLEAGIRLAEWCANETDRVYAILAESAGQTDTRKLVELVTRIASRNDGKVTVKLLQRANQRKYRTADLARLDLERLVERGIGAWETAPERPGGGGNRATSFSPPALV